MKIALVNTQAPFIRGGAEYLVDSLKVKLESYGHEVAIVSIPFQWHPAEIIPQQILANRLMRLDIIEPDMVIAHKFPTYFIPYPRKKLWLFHQFRQAYELWGTPYQDIPNSPEGQRIREIIIQADNLYLREAQEIYTNSKIVSNRLKKNNNISANGVLYPPLLQPEMFQPGEFGNYFFYPSRITAGKRQAIAIEAMKYVRSEFTLLLAGSPDTPEYGTKIEQMIAKFGVHDRVKMLGRISDEDKAHYMSNALGCLYLPYDEDSYGFVTLEAFQSHKPVIVFTDSGGTDEVVSHEFNGLVLEPTPQSLAEGMERLWENKSSAKTMGQNAFTTIKKHNISWDHVIDRLLS